MAFLTFIPFFHLSVLHALSSSLFPTFLLSFPHNRGKWFLLLTFLFPYCRGESSKTQTQAAAMSTVYVEFRWVFCEHPAAMELIRQDSGEADELYLNTVECSLICPCQFS